MAEEDIAKSWTSIVPEFFFDLIARVPPGILLVLLVLLEFGVLSQTNTDKLFATTGGFVIVLSILLFGAGYSVGIFLSVPGIYIGKLYFKNVWDHFTHTEEAILQEISRKLKLNMKFANGKPQTRSDWWRFHRVTHDYLKHKDKDARVMLPKMSAEASLCNNTAAALTVYPIIRLFHCGFHGQLSLLWFVVIVAIFVCMAQIRYRRMIDSQISYLRIVLAKEKSVSNREDESPEGLQDEAG